VIVPSFTCNPLAALTRGTTLTKVSEFDGVDDAPAPTLFIADTVKVWGIPIVSSFNFALIWILLVVANVPPGFATTA
jgi:hypothetical protein